MQFNSHQVLRLPVETHFTAQNKGLLQQRIQSKFPDAQCEIAVGTAPAKQEPSANVDSYEQTMTKVWETQN